MKKTLVSFFIEGEVDQERVNKITEAIHQIEEEKMTVVFFENGDMELITREEWPKDVAV